MFEINDKATILVKLKMAPKSARLAKMGKSNIIMTYYKYTFVPSHKLSSALLYDSEFLRQIETFI